MKESYVKLSIDDAIEMYHSGNEKFKKIALDAFGEIKLNYNFRLVKTLEDACNALDLNYICVVKEADSIANFSKSSAAMFKLNIVKKALNLNRDLHFINGPKKSYIYYPFNLLVSDGSTYYEDVDKVGICYFIGTPFRKKGYMTEAINAYVQFFFKQYSESEIIATILDANTPSWKVAEKSGFNLIEKKMYKDIDDEKEELYRFYVIRGQEDK